MRNYKILILSAFFVLPNLMYGIGKQCNGHKLRFDKSDFIEKSLEEMNDSPFKYISNEEGLEIFGEGESNMGICWRFLSPFFQNFSI